MCFKYFSVLKSSGRVQSGNENNRKVRKEGNINNYLKHLFSYVVGSIKGKI